MSCVPFSDEIIINSSYQEEQNQVLEATGTCLVNRNYIEPWNTTPFPDSFFPPINHNVSVIKLDPNHLYNSPSKIPQYTVTHVVRGSDVTPAVNVQLTPPQCPINDSQGEIVPLIDIDLYHQDTEQSHSINNHSDKSDLGEYKKD